MAVNPTLAALLLLAAAPAAAEEPAAVAPAEAPTESPPAAGEGTPVPAEAAPMPEGLVPPEPIGTVEVPMPPGAPPITEPVVVKLRLEIDEKGEVSAVHLEEGAGPPWDEAVLHAATGFRFRPATWNGQPVAVEVPFEQRFVPPEAPPEEIAEQKQLPSRLAGTLVEMGTRRPIPGATVVAAFGDDQYRATSDAKGLFVLPVPTGKATVEVEAPGYKRFLVHESLQDGQTLQVRYLVQRQSYDPYEATIVGKADREEVARTSLRGREITRVPGTFGDPFRVVGAMPGVGQVFSLLSYPIVRGAAPGSTGILLDGVRIPQLYHYLAGPAVIHPEFIERVDFYPGTFPLVYGGYTGGIVDGITRRARADEERTEVGIDLTNASMLLRRPVLGMNATVAGRYGYPGMLLSAFSEDAYASYWDYQARLDGGSPGSRWTAFAFGSYDEAGTVVGGEAQPDLRLQFHRLDLRYQLGDEERYDRFQITFGTDVLYGGSDQDTPPAQSFDVEPRLLFRRPLAEGLALHTGLQGSYHRMPSLFDNADIEETSSDGFRISDERWQVTAGAFLETPWWLSKDLLVTPGLRFDVWQNASTRDSSVDPRLTFRWRVGESETTNVWLKGGIGGYHQPPRLPLPIPGVPSLGLAAGLLGATQASLGSEVDFASGYLIDATGYFNYMDPVRFDIPPNGVTDYDALAARIGRSYGMELLLRKRDQGNLFGWVAYTLSRSERRYAGEWERFSFDRPHMLQLVAGLRLPRDWELGGRFQVQSGRPVNDIGEPVRRAAPFTRLDFRIDKRAVYREWMLDFYIDVINVMLAPEAVDEGSDAALRYILPTVGFRAVL